MTEPRDDTVYPSHIRDAIARVASYLDGISEREFMDTPLLQDGVIRQIQIIGEAAKAISPSLRAATPEIPWADIAGMRDKLVMITWALTSRRYGIPQRATCPC